MQDIQVLFLPDLYQTGVLLDSHTVEFLSSGDREEIAGPTIEVDYPLSPLEFLTGLAQQPGVVFRESHFHPRGIAVETAVIAALALALDHLQESIH